MGFRSVVAVASFASALALVGCAPASTTPPIASGPASEAIKVSANFGAQPKVDIPTPIRTEKTECSIVVEGTGPYAQDGQQLSVDLQIYNGSSGELIEGTSFSGSDQLSVVVGDALRPALNEGMKCARLDERMVLVIPPGGVFGEQGNPDIGVNADDSIVLVVDTHEIVRARASGTPQLSIDGMPSVVLAPNGQPGVTVPKTAPPSKQRTAVTIKGDGPVVKSGDAVLVHYSGFLWDGNAQFDSSWTRGQPAQFVVSDASDGSGEVIQGFSNAIIGQSVGSQVLTVIPPELAYGSQGSQTIPPGSTLVFVIDILAIR